MRTLIFLILTSSLGCMPKPAKCQVATASPSPAPKALATQTVLEIIDQVAMEHGIDPRLARAIASVESRLNTNAVGKHGEIGLYQLHPKYHNVTMGRVASQVGVAMQYLVRLRRECAQYGDAWFVCYNYGPSRRLKYPQEFPYYKKVMIAMEEI